MSTIHMLKRADFIFKNENDWEEVLTKSLARTPNELINELISSELKGRGGAGFPTGLKWKLTSELKSDQKYVICNADEGEPGTFKDREILSRVPFKVLTASPITSKRQSYSPISAPMPTSSMPASCARSSDVNR